MLAKVCSSAVNGIDAYPVEVEVNAGYGGTVIVNVLNNYLTLFSRSFVARPGAGMFGKKYENRWCARTLNDGQ